MFNKENGKKFLIVFTAAVAALAFHQIIVAPRIAKGLKKA